MKNRRTLSMLTGFAAALFASRWLIWTSSGTAVRVTVAADDINLGQPLNEAMVRTINWPRDSVPPSAFAAPGDRGRALQFPMNGRRMIPKCEKSISRYATISRFVSTRNHTGV
ncbi:SAF domain-containing protein [Paraburkholderia sp. JHI869]|uniref:SAF domain-containing protein n=1 Tax=Paraburkholderia sp. JHI869 TaxID=3112959 RepID=UPI003181C9E5